MRMRNLGRLGLGVAVLAFGLACESPEEETLRLIEANELERLQLELEELERLETQLGLTGIEGGQEGDLASAPSVFASEPAAEPAASPNEAAVIRFSPDPPRPGELLRAVVHMQDGASRPAKLQYTWNVAGHRIVDEQGAITLPKLRKNDTIKVSVSRENSGMLGSAVATIPNSRPKLLELNLDLNTTAGGEVWEASAWGQDPDGDKLEYRYTWLINDRQTEHSGTTYPTAELSRGDRVKVRVVASDGEDDSEVAVSGTGEIANSAPDFASTPPLLDPSGVYRYHAKATDPDDDRGLRFELVEGPDGMEINSRSGELIWTPTNEQVGRHKVEIAVRDPHNGRSVQSWVIPVALVERYDPSPAARP